MADQTPIEEAAGYLEARRGHYAMLRQEDTHPIDTIWGKPLTARTVQLLLEQVQLDGQRLTELRRQLDAADAAAPADLDADATQSTWTAPDGTPYDLKAVLTDRFEQTWSCEGWLRRIGSGDLFPLMISDFGDHMEFMSIRDAIACYGPLTVAAEKPNPLESAVAEARADIAATPAEPEPAPIRHAWLIEAGDD